MWFPKRLPASAMPADKPSARRTTRNRTLSLEALEGRQLLATFTVSSLADETDGNTTAGHLSLREAIGLANANADSDVINFDPALQGTITLTAGVLTIKSNVNITGPGADKITIDGNNKSSIFITGDNATSVPAVEIDNLTLTHAKGIAGGAIHNQGNLTLRGLNITANTANYGGAILSGSNVSSEQHSYSLIVMDSTISQNQSVFSGGGIMAGAGTTTFVINSTVSGNSTGGPGGGIHNIGLKATLTNDTITQNIANQNADGFGGGLSGFGFTLNNNIIVQNQSNQGAGLAPDDIANPVDPLSNANIVGDSSSAGELKQGVKGNFVGNNGVGTIAANTVIESTLALNGGTTSTHALRPGSIAIDKGYNAKVVDAQGVALANDQRGLKRIINGDGVGTTSVDIGAFEVQGPAIDNMGSAVAFTEHGAAVVVTSTATVTDNLSNFGGGKLLAAVTTNMNAADRLYIRDGGTAAGKIGVAGTNVTFGGIIMGTFHGGVVTAPSLQIDLNATASLIAVRSLIRNIMFKTMPENSSLLARTISLQVGDGTGVSVPATKTVNIINVNDPPILKGLSDPLSYTLNATQVPISSTATVTDSDSANFNNGKLTIQITTGANASNRIFVGGAFTMTGQQIIRSGNVIGTLNVGGGVGTTNYEVTLTANATPAIMQEFLRALKFKTGGKTATAGDRVLNFTLTDGAGGTSAPVTKTITVS